MVADRFSAGSTHLPSALSLGSETTAKPFPSGDLGPFGQSPLTDTVPASTSTPFTQSSHAYVRGYINSVGDQDWYAINLAAGQTYTFAMNGFGKGAIADTVLSLRNSSGTEVASNDDSGPLAASKLTFTASSTGTYYIAAGGWEGPNPAGSVIGQYILTMNNGSTPYFPVVAVNDIADYLTNTYWEVNASRAHQWGATSITFNCEGLEPERATLARLAFQTWADVCNLTFSETFGAAQITLDDNDSSGAYANSSFNGSGIISSATVNVAKNWFGGNDAVDSYTFQTFIHEIGHTLGLGHGGPYNGSATYGTDNSYANDSWQLSIMSYMDQSEAGTASERFVMTPQMADILAVQSLYGAVTTRAGDTVYGFNGTAGALFNFSTYTTAPSLTIYDSGGSDTLDCSGYSNNQTIDLTPGAFCSVGGYVGNIGIFNTTTIERAIGGSGADSIVGNSAGNWLKGGIGNDTIHGGGGTDSAVFAGLRSAYTLTDLGGGSLRVTGLDGTDTLSSVEQLIFDDQILAWPPSGTHENEPVHLQDFTADGQIDLLWRNDSGLVALWVLKNGILEQEHGLAAGPTGYGPAGTGDFDGDGTSDLLWANDSASMALWTIQNGNLQRESGIGVPPSGYTPAGTGDFNGDATSDVLWRNSSGNVALWEMHAGHIEIERGVAAGPTGYQIAGIGDLNGDATSDVLWRNSSGNVALWEMHAGHIQVERGVAAGPTGYQIAGIGDFNGDGTGDVLWRDGSGNVALWEMHAGHIQVERGVAAGPIGYQIVGIGDVNGDGTDDVVWRNAPGNMAVWEIGGGHLMIERGFGSIDSSWSLI